MWGIFALIGIIGGLVALAKSEKSDEPFLKTNLQKWRLSRILAASRKRRLTPTEIEDGRVLSKRLNENDLTKWFEKEARR